MINVESKYTISENSSPLLKINPKADSIPFFVDENTASTTGISLMGKSIIANTTSSANRDTLELGSIAIQDDDSCVLKNELNIKSTINEDGSVIGDELLTENNWTSIDWTGNFVDGFTHTTGNTSVLSNTIQPIINEFYQIIVTITNKLSGHVTMDFGGIHKNIWNNNLTLCRKTNSSNNFTLTPSSDFDGTVIVSIKKILNFVSPFLTILDSNNVVKTEYKSLLNYNLAIGKFSGNKITSGINNVLIGDNAGSILTTGYSNTQIGVNAGEKNNDGFNNICIGENSGFNNISGYKNVFLGAFAGGCIADGQTPCDNIYQSVFIGSGTKAKYSDDWNEIVIGTDVVGAGSDTINIGNTIVTNNNHLLLSNESPTISGFGTSASVINANGTAAFTINIGTNNSASTGTILLPTAANGWCCYIQNVTNTDSNIVSQTGGTNSTVTIKNYSRTTGLESNWTDSDILRVMCLAY